MCEAKFVEIFAPNSKKFANFFFFSFLLIFWKRVLSVSWFSRFLIKKMCSFRISFSIPYLWIMTDTKIHIFFIGNSIFHLSLVLRTKFWKMSLKVLHVIIVKISWFWIWIISQFWGWVVAQILAKISGWRPSNRVAFKKMYKISMMITKYYTHSRWSRHDECFIIRLLFFVFFILLAGWFLGKVAWILAVHMCRHSAISQALVRCRRWYVDGGSSSSKPWSLERKTL